MNRNVNKGKRGEYEFSQLLTTLLGEEVVVNPHGNSADIRAIPGLSIEVKRQETLNINGWWRQALRQAEETSGIPVLAYRQNRKEWQICLPAYLLTLKDKDNYIQVNWTTFKLWLLEYLESVKW